MQRTIAAQRLIAPGTHLLVAVSGGADSTALLLALHEVADPLRLRLGVAHLHHGLRGDEADGDAAFVEELAARLGCRCVVGRADVARRARARGVSVEMAAREARYRFLADHARTLGAGAVATAHQAGDQAETVLLKLARGSGPDALAGIAPRTVVHGVPVVRPLLEVTRAQVEAFLRERHAAWREDATNRERTHLRNRVRHEILPTLAQRLNPDIVRVLCRTAGVLRDEHAWLDGLLAERLAACVDERGRLRVADVRDAPVAARRRVLRRWLRNGGAPVRLLTFDTGEAADRLLCRRQGSGSVPLPGGLRVRREYGVLVLEAAGADRPGPAFRRRIALRGETLLSDPPLRVVTEVRPGIRRDAGGQPGRLPAAASLRRDAVGRHHLVLRSWRPGDRIRPLGMQGSKKVQDIFVDGKVPAARRARIPLLECGGRIAWIPGYRIARDFAVPDATTDALQIRIEPL